MKLLLVTSSYSSTGQGSAAAGLFVHDFAVALTKAHVTVNILAPTTGSAVDRDDSLAVSRFVVPKLPLSLLNPASPGDWVAIVRTMAAGRRAVQQACLEGRPDHILALWALPSGAWARRAARQFSIPYSIWALGSDIWGLGKLPLVRGYLATVLREAAHCFADGIKLAADVQRIGGRDCRFLASGRMFGPPGRRLPNKAPPYRLAFLGRWHPNKGPDLLLDALAQLTESEWTRIEAVRVCGGGPLETEVNRRVKALTGAGHPVKLDGYLDHAAAHELFEWADYVIIPSRVESIPVVFSDAMQMHRPVIAMPVGDLASLLETYGCGIVADEVSAQGMARAIRRALDTTPGGFTGGVMEAAEAFDVRRAAADCLAALNS